MYYIQTLTFPQPAIIRCSFQREIRVPISVYISARKRQFVPHNLLVRSCGYYHKLIQTMKKRPNGAEKINLRAVWALVTRIARIRTTQHTGFKSLNPKRCVVGNTLAIQAFSKTSLGE